MVESRAVEHRALRWVWVVLLVMTGRLEAAEAQLPTKILDLVPPALTGRMNEQLIRWEHTNATLVLMRFEGVKVEELAKAEVDLPLMPIWDWVWVRDQLFVVQPHVDSTQRLVVSLLNTNDLKLEHRWELDHDQPIERAALNRHRRRLLCVGSDGRMYLWQVEKDPYDQEPQLLQEAKSLLAGTLPVTPSANFPRWSPLGNQVVCRGAGGGLQLLDGQDGVIMGRFGTLNDDPVFRDELLQLKPFAFSQREKRMAVFRHSETEPQNADLVVWDNWGLKFGTRLPERFTQVSAMAFDRMGDLLVVASSGQISVWHVAQEKKLRQWSCPEVELIQAHPWKSWIAVKTRNEEIVLFDLERGLELARFKGAKGSISQLGFNYDGRLVFAHGNVAESPILTLWQLPQLP